jgi:hypothetical protein
MSEMTHETLRALADGDDQMVWLTELGVPPPVVETMRRAVRAHADTWKADVEARNYSARERVRLQNEVMELNTEHFALTRLCGEANDALGAARAEVAELRGRVGAAWQRCPVCRGEMLPPAPETPA